MDYEHKISLAVYDEKFLELSWQWLNDPEINELTNSGTITKEMQRNWFESLKSRDDYKVWGIETDGRQIGVMGLKNISGTEAEYFGYIGEKEFWNRGLSKKILQAAMSEAGKLALSEIRLKVTNVNTRAIKAYKNFGFVSEKTEGGMTFMRIKICEE